MNPIPLESGEQILSQTRKHWFTFLRDAGGVLGIGIGLFAIVGLTSLPVFADWTDARFLRLLAFAEILWILILWSAFWVLWTKYYLGLWVITNRRIMRIEQERLFSRSITSWQLEAVRDLRIETKNPLQAFFNYGLVLFRPKGAARMVRMEGIPHPDLISNTILHQMEKYRTLEETSKNQETLLHTVSHEVKAHLTKNEAILASIAEGDFKDAPEKARAIAKTALQETRKGVDMVMDLLSSSDFKTGSMSFTFALFDFSVAVHNLLPEFEREAQEKGLTLTSITAPGAYEMRGDAEKVMSHVVRNLIENALRYTPKGGIEVALARIENAILFSVKDSGVGISDEDMPRLFTEGGKGKDSSRVNPSSTGYGLFIAKQVVEAHGGVIWARSEGVNRGSTFYACFPAAQDSSLSGSAV